MKLLFDHNISPELITRLADLFPSSNHVYPLNLHEEEDVVVWRYARTNDFIVVSKDADFAEISMVHGFPPKLLWLRLGNCTTAEIEEVIRERSFSSADHPAQSPRSSGRNPPISLGRSGAGFGECSCS
ncbi:MAG TPA: DUF5615 family PIN-like protein [Thermoanaerobaculia bacterium]|nr:DUF5615 family PIN-like protein [Thermoanaerobaculia bacterium]